MSALGVVLGQLLVAAGLVWVAGVLVLAVASGSPFSCPGWRDDPLDNEVAP